MIGIGGSYLGSRAAIESLSHTFHNQLSDTTQVYLAGQNISSTYVTHLLENNVFPWLAYNSFVVQHIEKPISQLTQISIVSMFVSEEKLARIG